MGVTFANQLGIDVNVFWLNGQGAEVPSGTVGSFSDMNLNTFAGHAFRFRSPSGAITQSSLSCCGFIHLFTKLDDLIDIAEKNKKNSIIIVIIVTQEV